MFKIEWVGTPNFNKGRKGYSPIAIVNHITAGLYPGCLSWMQNTQAKGSANYLITRTGKILQLVKDEDTAWANGGVNKPNWSLLKSGVNPNYYTISIEHEGYKEKGGDGNLTDVQFKASVWLHKFLTNKWKIPIDAEHIIGHYRIDSVSRANCPGKNFPWEKIFYELKGDDEMALLQWQKDIGIKAVDGLASKKLLLNPQDWKNKLSENTPNWLFFEMINRLVENKGK